MLVEWILVQFSQMLDWNVILLGLGRFFPAWNRAKEIRLDGGNKQLPGSFSPGVKKVTLAKHG